MKTPNESRTAALSGCRQDIVAAHNNELACRQLSVPWASFSLGAQLLNKGEQGDKKYTETVPWLEAAALGGVLATKKVGIRTFVGLLFAETFRQ